MQELRNFLRRVYLRLINTRVYRFFINLSKRLSRKGIYPFLDDQFAAIPRGSRVLNVGAGGQVNERLNSFARNSQFTVVSQDIDERRSPDILGDICTLALDPDSFDAVSICEVLEHLHSPHAALNNLHTALKPGGTLILTVPFIFPIHERPYDYYRYTKFGLAHLLREFEEVEIRERNGWGEAINVLFARHIMNDNVGSKIAAPLFIVFCYALLPLFWLMGRVINTDFITSGYLVRARKGRER